MASFPPSASFSPSQTLNSLDPNASALNSGLRHRRYNGGPEFRGASAAGKAAAPTTATALAAPPPRSSLCLQTNSADPVTPLNKGNGAGFPQHSRTTATTNPFASGLFPPTQPLSSSVSTLPSSSEPSAASWVCVYGVDASIRELVLDRFASYGRIVHQKAVGVNAVALRYDSPLSAGKALCQNRFQVRGHYCGVFAMSDNDTSLLALETPHRPMEPRGGPAPTMAPASLFAPSAGAATSARPGSGLFARVSDEREAADYDDIYQHHKPYNRGRDKAHQHESLCLRIMRWLLSSE